MAPEFAIGTGRHAVTLSEYGFTPESRHADWTNTEFTADSPSHVSAYRLSTA
ncbi:hypothetical protein EV651_102448 [Kribbella sp. VKM Ac-2571]|uniref:hypothetical protein n=1 Tax=Kribbella sp. VKM Ac-2571 TaxID=2512222 RepID=UPI0010DC7016|nr:hypothetical protein [Kribbella sp. VKM Ac-2571]TDO68525.1 hypothetical protein EV651_102448 [Kribbella sp. VKM Ac-2571]